MTENGLFVLGGPETQLHDIVWAVHEEKTVVEARARKISGSSRLRWVVGAKRWTEVSAFLSCTRVCASIVKEHAVPPCLVLVIDDNLYGLMVALSYI